MLPPYASEALIPSFHAYADGVRMKNSATRGLAHMNIYLMPQALRALMPPEYSRFRRAMRHTSIFIADIIHQSFLLHYFTRYMIEISSIFLDAIGPPPFIVSSPIAPRQAPSAHALIPFFTTPSRQYKRYHAVNIILAVIPPLSCSIFGLRGDAASQPPMGLPRDSSRRFIAPRRHYRAIYAAYSGLLSFTGAFGHASRHALAPKMISTPMTRASLRADMPLSRSRDRSPLFRTDD